MRQEKNLAAALEHQAQQLETRKSFYVRRFDKAIAALRTLAESADLFDAESLNRLTSELSFSLPHSSYQPDNLDLFSDVESGPEQGDAARVAPFSSGTLSERMLRYFRANQNTPATNAEIREAIGSNRGSVAMVLYKTHSNFFEKADASEGDHLQRWRMSPLGAEIAAKFSSG